MKYSENFVVYIVVQTTDGFRYIYYTAADHDNLGDDKYIHHGLGTGSRDGYWHTITRDLEPTVSIPVRTGLNLNFTSKR